MLAVRNLSKTYHTASGRVDALKNVSFDILPGERVGIVGANGSGKSTLIRLIGGVEAPTSGTISRGMSISWPLGFRSAFQPKLTGYENIRFMARIYNYAADGVIAYVEEFSELGSRLRDPVNTYSAGMRAKISLGLSLAFEFDCYLIDEIIAVGDRQFRQKCQVELFEKRGDRALLMVSHQPNTIRKYCKRGLALRKGHAVEMFDLHDMKMWRRFAATA